MKKIKNVYLISLILTSVSTVYIYTFHKQTIGMIGDKIGITHNTFDFIIPERLLQYAQIFWVGDYEEGLEPNRMLLYYRFPQNDIPDFYGKNRIEIRIGKMIYDRIGVLKLCYFAKYDYKIHLKEDNNNLIINWEISNWYEPDIWQGTDTIKKFQLELN